MGRLENKVALVTGGGSGFGEGIVETFAREGASVAIVDIDLANAETVARRIGQSAIAVRADVSKAADVARAVDAVADAFGRTRHPRKQRRHQPSQPAHARGRARTSSTGSSPSTSSRSISSPAGRRAAHARAGPRHDPQCRLDGRPATATRIDVVQRQQGRRARDHKVDGGRARAGPDPRLRARAGRRRDAASCHLHGRGHAGEARAFRAPFRSAACRARRTSPMRPSTSLPTRPTS